MPRLGTNTNVSSDLLESKMLPNVESSPARSESIRIFLEELWEREDDMAEYDAYTREEIDQWAKDRKRELGIEDFDEKQSMTERGGAVDLMGDGVHKVYMNKGQLDIYNFGSRNTKVRASRGFGKTILLGLFNYKCVLGLRRQMGLFCGASAKQLMCRTMPNVLKFFNQIGCTEGVFYFRGQPPAKLHWDSPLAKPRVWENAISFQNGALIMAISMAVRGSANGINSAWISGDETKYLPWMRVKEEVFPTLRGDFMPPEARRVEVKRWGYGTDPRINNYYCSTMFVSDAGLTQSQCEWEKEEVYETREVNAQIAEMLAELEYLKRHNPRMALELAQNDVFLRRLHLLRSQSETFWNFSSVENISMLGGEAWLRQMKRELPDLMYRIQILGQKKGAAKDGFYSNFDIDIHGYVAPDIDFADRFSTKVKGTALDAQKWPTKYETESIDYDRCQAAADNCSLDSDVDYHEPLRIAIDAGANMNCMVVGQTRTFEGKPTIMILKSLYVLNERKLRSLCRDFTDYYKPFLRRCGEVVFYFTNTIKQGNTVAYAVEGAEEYRFDRVVSSELQQLGWKVTTVDMGPAYVHELKHRYINEMLSFQSSPAFRINREAGRNDYLITAIENAGLVPGTYRKDKSREKLKSEEGVGGDYRTRTDITDAMDDLLMGVKFHGEGRPKIGGALRGRYKFQVPV